MRNVLIGVAYAIAYTAVVPSMTIHWFIGGLVGALALGWQLERPRRVRR